MGSMPLPLPLLLPAVRCCNRCFLCTLETGTGVGTTGPAGVGVGTGTMYVTGVGRMGKGTEVCALFRSGRPQMNMDVLEKMVIVRTPHRRRSRRRRRRRLRQTTTIAYETGELRWEH